MSVTESTRAATRWVTRIVPVILTAAVVYATFVVVGRVCSDYLINTRGEVGSAIAILILYFLLLLLMVATYLRTILTVLFDPGVVPLGPAAIERRQNARDRRKQGGVGVGGGIDFESQPYYGGPDPNPDSPGLELFYTKDVFICENDGRPKWCSECCNWKADRVHHSSEINRCVYRMDHYCPWVGGMIGENSFKFFVQFTTYTACYCALVLGAVASSLRKKSREGLGLDPTYIPAIVLAGFFGLFTFLMTVTSLRYILLNMTNVDALSSQSKVYQLAIRVPRGTTSTDKFSVVTYPLPKPGEATNGYQAHGAANGNGAFVAVGPARRDDLATRTFAILKTEPGENPWDLGLWRNWRTVMGQNPLDWLLPLRRSPCVDHDSLDGFYPMGYVLADVCARYDLASLAASDGATGLEMKGLPAGRRREQGGV
ncbi:zf-DHHC-domain-containing protein [Hypoxylon fuscum]|nr:zf-DHHC-domain-containing protein [Hypoxylon fuscum]